MVFPPWGELLGGLMRVPKCPWDTARGLQSSHCHYSFKVSANNDHLYKLQELYKDIPLRPCFLPWISKSNTEMRQDPTQYLALVQGLYRLHSGKLPLGN